MSFKKKQGSTDQNEQAARSTVDRSTATESAAEQSVPDPAQMGQVWPSIERAEEHFGMEIPDESTLQRLELHEQTYGREMHEWIAEGMPADIMGNPRNIEAFRQRQAERPPEVPTNIERRNQRSVLRSEKAATETSPAGETAVPEPVREVISSRGRSLDPSIQRAMEDRMGDSFGDVRIHTGPAAADACESINARAFTVGNHIAFNQGEYDPSTPAGQHVLAHELAHVRQQTEGAVSMLPQEDMELEIDPDHALEREAEEAAQEAMADEPVVVNRMGCKMHIQRVGKDKAAQYASMIAEDLDEETIEDRVQWAKATDITPEELEKRQEFEKALLAEKMDNKSEELETKLQQKRERLRQLHDELNQIENEVAATETLPPELSNERWETAEESTELQRILTELEAEKAEFEQHAEAYMELTEMSREELKTLLEPLEAVKKIAVGDAKATLKDSVTSLLNKAIKKASGFERWVDTIYKRLKDADLVYGSWKQDVEEVTDEKSSTLEGVGSSRGDQK